MSKNNKNRTKIQEMYIMIEYINEIRIVKVF